MKNTIYKILAIFLLTGAAFLNLHAQNRVVLFLDGTSASNSAATQCDSGVIMQVTPVGSWTSMNFSIMSGQISTHSVVISNSIYSSGPLVINPGTLTAPFSFSFSGPTTIGVGGSVTVTITFTSTSANTYNQTLNLPNNSQNLCNSSIALTGVCSCNVVNMNSPITNIDFHSVRLLHQSTYYITIKNLNTSCNDLTITLSSLSTPFSVSPTGTSYIIGHPGQQTIVISFRPTSIGPFNATLSITNNSTNSSHPYIINMTGNGIN